MKTKSIMVNTMLNTIRMTLTIIVPLITYPYITRIFGAEGVGEYEWVKSVISVLILIASLGISTYAVREGSKIREDREKFSKFAQELFGINLIATVICYAMLGGLIAAVPRFYTYRVYLLIYSLNVGLSALSLDWVYSVYEDYKYITVRQIIVQIVSVLGLFLLVRDENDLIIYIIITTISNSGANIFNFIRARKYVDFKILKCYNPIQHIAPVMIFFGTRLAMNAYNSLDTIILGMMTSNESVGYYNVAVKINTILVTFFSAMSPVYLPRMMKHISEHNEDNYTLLLNKAIKLKTILIYPMVGGMFCFAPQVVWLIAGEGFANAVYTLRILAFVLLFVILSSIIQKDIMIPKGKEKIVLTLTMFAAVLNVVISIILISYFDYNGAAYGSLIAESAICIAGAFILKKNGINLFIMIPKCSWRYLISTLVMCCWCIVASKIFVNNLSIVLIGIPVAVAIYFGLLILMKDEFIWKAIRFFLGKITRLKH